ncbi:MAG TPA: PqqD family protein [Thermoanaerobaculia bacterium]|nr:PqqD family protein [Thermoanaerobaculia bacterium]
MTTVHSIPGDAVAWREVDGEFVLISVETTHYYSLNSSGSDVWRILLEGPQTIDSIAGALAVRHGLDRLEVGAQVEALLENLCAEGLLRVEEGSAPSVAVTAPIDGNGGYEPPSLLKYEALERLILSGE